MIVTETVPTDFAHPGDRRPAALQARLLAACAPGRSAPEVQCGWEYEPRGTSAIFVCRLQSAHEGDHVCDHLSHAALSTGGLPAPLISVPRGTDACDPRFYDLTTGRSPC